MVILNAIIPVALLALIGVGLVRWNFVSLQFFNELSKVVFKVFVPVFLFVNVYQSGLQDVGISLVAYFIPVLIMFVLIAVFWSHRMALTATFSNTVLVGIPVIVALIGEKGLSISLAIISMHSLLLFSAFYLFSTKTRVTPSRFKTSFAVFSNPVIIGLLLGVIAKYSQITIPSQLFQPLEMLASAALPLALIILGSSLAQIRLFDKAVLKPSSLLIGLKMLLLPLLVWISCALIWQLEKEMALALTLLAACPTGISVMPFVEPVAEDKAISHSVIALSSLISIATIPIIASLLGYSLM